MFQRDYILRMVEQAAQAIARVLGLITAQKYDHAEQELGGAYAALGLDRELIGVLSAATFARQLGDPERIAAAIRVLICDAQLCARRGDRARREGRLRLARGLLDHLESPEPALQRELEAASASD